MATADRKGQIVISSPDFLGAQIRFPALGEAIWSLSFTSNGSSLLAGAEGGAHLIDVSTAETLRRFALDYGSVTRATMHADSSRIAVSTSMGEVLVWPTDQTAMPLTLKVSDNLVWSVAFNPDGSLLAAADSDETVSVWRLEDGMRLQNFTGHARGATDLLFLHDGASLVASDRSGGLHVWDLSFGKLIGRIPNAHAGAIWRLANHPDGQQFASSGEDGIVRIWDVLSTKAACNLSDGVLGTQQHEQYLGAARDDVCASLRSQ